MSETYASAALDEDKYMPGLYEIRIKGHLDDRWEAWFESLTLTRDDNGDTVLNGAVVDQAALYGFLRKVRDLGNAIALGHLPQIGPGGRASSWASRCVKGELPLMNS